MKNKGEMVTMPTESFELQMLKKLSRGELKVKLMVRGEECEGYVHTLDFSKDSRHLTALVAITDPRVTTVPMSVKVNIFIDGRNGRDIDIDVCEDQAFFLKVNC